MDLTPTPLRFGIMCRGGTLAAWQRQAVEMLLTLPNVSLVLLIIENSGADGGRRRRAPLQQILWNNYRRMLRKPAATRRVCIGDWVSQYPSLMCALQPTGSGGELHLSEQDIKAVAAYELDFVLHFAFKGVRGPILDTPRYGIWSFNHTDTARLREAPSGFWEIYHREPVTGAALQRLTNSPEGALPLKKGYFRTKFHSYRGNIDMVYGESTHWPAAVCQQLRLDSGQLKYASSGVSGAAVVPVPRLPAPWQLLVFGWKMVSSNIERLYGALFLQAEFWNIGVIEQPIHAFLQPQLLQGVAISTAPLHNRNIFYADCFGREENGQTQIYFERYDYRTGLGTIARLSYPWQPDEQPAPVFDLPYHLSYPYLYGPYCIPESSEAEQVARYDLRDQPAPAQPLLPGVPGVDSTMFEHEGRYWMMYTRLDRDPNLNLFIAYADQQEGPWHEHAQNPVLTDVRCARPGGTPFRHEGRLYRPAQNYSRGYGSSLVINEIVELTPTTYLERPAAELTSLHPEYAAGMHTVAAIGPNRTAIDFKRHGFSPSALQHNLRRLLKRWIPRPD